MLRRWNVRPHWYLQLTMQSAQELPGEALNQWTSQAGRSRFQTAHAKRFRKRDGIGGTPAYLTCLGSGCRLVGSMPSAVQLILLAVVTSGLSACQPQTCLSFAISYSGTRS